MAQSREETFLDRELAQITRRLAGLNARLIGYEIALAAIIGALDRTGALPVASAKSAIDEAIGAIPATAQTSDVLAVLRQLSGRLEPTPQTLSEKLELPNLSHH